MSIRQTILQVIRQTMEENDVPVPGQFPDDLVLLESGLDSMGFAIAVIRLEGELGYDPFVLMDEPVYPRTLGEFIQIYEQFAENGRGD